MSAIDTAFIRAYTLDTAGATATAEGEPVGRPARAVIADGAEQANFASHRVGVAAAPAAPRSVRPVRRERRAPQWWPLREPPRRF